MGGWRDGGNPAKSPDDYGRAAVALRDVLVGIAMCQNRCKRDFPGFAKKIRKNVLGVISGGRRQNVQKMSKKCPGVQLGFGKMSKKCQKNVPKTFF